MEEESSDSGRLLGRRARDSQCGSMKDVLRVVVLFEQVLEYYVRIGQVKKGMVKSVQTGKKLRLRVRRGQ